MAKINLKSNEMSSRRPNSQGSNKSLLFGILTLAVGLAGYGMVRYMTIQVTNESEDVRAEILQKEEALNTDEVKEVYDFQDRLVEVEGKIETKIMQSEILDKIEKYTLSQTTFTKLKTEKLAGKTTVEATITVENHSKLAEQIESFGLMDSDINIFLKSSKVNQEGTGIDGELIFSVEDVN